MKNKALLLVTLLIASGSVLAESETLGNAGKQLLKETATSAAPKEAVEGVEAAGKTVEGANKLKESVKSPTDALKGQAQDIATESAKQTVNEAQDVATNRQKAKERSGKSKRKRQNRRENYKNREKSESQSP